jgi:hypothetical protein
LTVTFLFFFVLLLQATPAIRRRLGIGQTPFVGWANGSLTEQGTTAPGIHSSYLYVNPGAAPAPFALHVEDSLLYSLSFLHAGAPKFWVVVRPADRARLERRLREGAAAAAAAARPPLRPCSQFARHRPMWVPIATLACWDIGYTLVEQRQGELVVTAPGAYHEGWNGGANVAEAINYGDGRSAARLRGYRHCTGDCPNRLVIEWPRGAHGDNNAGLQEAAEPRSWSLSQGAGQSLTQEEVRRGGGLGRTLLTVSCGMGCFS